MMVAGLFDEAMKLEVEVTAGATYYLKVEPVLGSPASYTLTAN